MTKDKVRIAIVDDHQIVIDGLLSMLEGHDRFKVVLQTTEPKKMVGLLKQHDVDLLLTDIMMPELTGNMLAKEVKKQFPQIRILALSMSGQGELVNEMINDADIAGYVLKNIGKQEFLIALEKIAGGGIYFSEEVLAEMIKDSGVKKENEDTHLTRREIEIIQLIEKEYNNKQIADSLFISERTVETHRKNIFRKTKTNSAIGLIKYAYEHRLIQ
ncbi:MAG: response regulator transcription factor [Flavihumibacter sp.]|nr:response regulator transcription factor [Flavihumibacter sp.]